MVNFYNKIKSAKIRLTILLIIFSLTAIFLFVGFNAKNELLAIYKNGESVVIRDRNNEIVLIKPNDSGYYAEYLDEIPDGFKKPLLKKEDKYFYYHPGVNPVSAARAFLNYLMGDKNLTSSTITQQLVKVLLSNESERSFKNKIKEAVYAVWLEIYLSKEEILKMYVNSIYFGNRTQGLAMAGRLYFNAPPSGLSDGQILRLLTSISNPSGSHPFAESNLDSAKILANRLNVSVNIKSQISGREIALKKQKFSEYLKDESYFELSSLNIDCWRDCRLKTDSELTKNLREILKRNLASLSDRDVVNGAIVVLKLPANELLAIVGSPDPSIDAYGYKINLAVKPRPIGSTVKPFIYLKGFEKNLRPYTRVEDKEYKYTIGSGFAFYPKNYDYKYRGDVSLHYALSNSLNVPSVQVLEFVGLENFYGFLLDDLELDPIQNLENYQLGIALGGLEMDLFSLSYYFSLLAQDGRLSRLEVYEDGRNFDFKSSTNFLQNKKISEPRYVQLVNKILSDRKTGIEQFGLKSNLNLAQNNYAVKTGTSREFHDSWTIGYTPDFLAGVWLGNSDDTAMDKISGQAGAGRIWQETMNLLINSKYNQKTPFDFSLIKEYARNKDIEYGLAGDDYEEYLKLLKDDSLILTPHNQDTFLLEEQTMIPLKARQEVRWRVNDKFLGQAKEVIFEPKDAGSYIIKAATGDREEVLVIIINDED